MKLINTEALPETTLLRIAGLRTEYNWLKQMESDGNRLEQTETGWNLQKQIITHWNIAPKIEIFTK